MGQIKTKTMWQHIRRSPYQSLAAIMIMVLTFFIASIFLLLIIGGAKTIDYFETRPQITVFLRDEATSSQINILENTLKNTGKVSSTRFVSKEEALKIYKEQNKDDPLLLELVTANILPASLEISAVNVRDLEGLAGTLKNSEIISEVIFQKDIVDTLTNWTNTLRTIGLVLFLILSAISILIMITVIGMKISLRREEIEIMRLVGATSWYIRWPFILEGMLYGLIGSFVAWVLSYAIILYAGNFLKSFLAGVSIFPLSPVLMLEILAIQMLAAIILGIVGSFFAVLRYLK